MRIRIILLIAALAVGISAGVQGRGGAAQVETASLAVGEVIEEINKHPVKTLSDYQEVIKGVKGDCLFKTSRGYFLIKGD
ncbi:MAG: hypothetical protein WC559_01775 [Candidatus Omnitrophota bacterium]